jgi:hypothetical protein
MNAKEMLDKAVKIIARQDVDRDLMLMFMNLARRAVLRDRDITRFYARLNDVPVVNGAIDTVPLKLKSAKYIEYGQGAKKTPLAKIADYDTARKEYPDFTVPGDLRHYLELGTSIIILPSFTGATVNIIGEVWPDDLLDSVTSIDITTTEIPEAWIYLAVAEYFDYFDEGDKGNYWRQKGVLLVDNYIEQLQLQASYGVHALVGPYFSNRYSGGDY